MTVKAGHDEEGFEEDSDDSEEASYDSNSKETSYQLFSRFGVRGSVGARLRQPLVPRIFGYPRQSLVS